MIHCRLSYYVFGKCSAASTGLDHNVSHDITSYLTGPPYQFLYRSLVGHCTHYHVQLTQPALMTLEQ